MNIPWIDPWQPIEDPELGRMFEEELQRELSPSHPLAGLPLLVVGKHGNTDDFLFQVSDGSDRVALVHLSWTGKPETPPWPQSMLFASVEEWIEKGMQPDHDETKAGG
jgi:hypothetical protein